MSAILVPHLVRSGLQQLWEAIAARSVAGEARMGQQELSELIYDCLALGDLVNRHWELLWKLLALGLGDDDLIPRVKEIVGISQHLSKSCAKVRDLANQCTQLSRPYDATDLAQLDACIRRVAELRGKAQNLLEWAETPSPPVDVAPFLTKSDPATREGFRPADRILEDIEKRLQG